MPTVPNQQQYSHPLPISVGNLTSNDMKFLLSKLVALCALGTSSAFVVLPQQQARSKTSLSAASQYLGGLGGEAQQTGSRVQMDTNIPTGDLAPGRRMPPTDAERDTVRTTYF